MYSEVTDKKEKMRLKEGTERDIIVSKKKIEKYDSAKDEPYIDKLYIMSNKKTKIILFLSTNLNISFISFIHNTSFLS